MIIIDFYVNLCKLILYCLCEKKIILKFFDFSIGSFSKDIGAYNNNDNCIDV